MRRISDEELWVRFACAALSCLDDGLYPTSEPMEIQRECMSVAAYADEMCRIFNAKFKNK